MSRSNGARAKPALPIIGATDHAFRPGLRIRIAPGEALQGRVEVLGLGVGRELHKIGGIPLPGGEEEPHRSDADGGRRRRDEDVAACGGLCGAEYVLRPAHVDAHEGREEVGLAQPGVDEGHRVEDGEGPVGVLWRPGVGKDPGHRGSVGDVGLEEDHVVLDRQLATGSLQVGDADGLGVFAAHQEVLDYPAPDQALDTPRQYGISTMICANGK